MGTIDNNTNIEAALQEKLKASNLSEKEIKEIIPEILKLTNKIKEDVENSQTETTTKNFLLDLRQDVTNNSNVSIDIKRNKWTVIWTIELNNITNNFYVINKSDFQAQPKAQPEKNLSTPQSGIQQKAQPETTSNTKPETVSSTQPRIQQKAQPEATSNTKPETISSTQPTIQQKVQPETTSNTKPETISSTQPTVQQKAQPEAISNTKPETVSSSQSTIQQKVQPETVSSTQPDQININLDSHEWYDKALSQLIFEIDWCISTAKYKRWLNKSWKETLKTAKAKLKQYKDIISDKKRMLEHELKAKNKLNEKNPDKAPLTVSISAAEINELKNRRFQRKQKIEIDIKEWQNGKSSNLAPWPNQSQEQITKWNKVDIHHIEYDSKLNAALQDAAFLRIIDNNQDRAREFLQAIANNSLSDAQITVCQSRMVQLAPYFEQYGLTNQVHRCIQTRGWRYTQNVVNYWNMDWETAYKTWWVVGWLNNTLIKAFPNAKPQQVSNFTNIAVAAGWIYAIYRIWKWFFGKNKKWERNLWWKAAWLAWIYFAPQLLLWKDWFSLLWDILTWKADFWELWYRASNCLRFMNNNSPELYAQMAPWVLWMSIFPQNYTVKDVKSLQQTFSDQNSRKQRYTVTYNRLNKDNSALANEFKNTFNTNQYNENERKAFLAKLWITDNTSDDTVIFNEAMKLTDKKTSLQLRMKSQWKKRNPVFNKEIDEYLKQGWDFNPNDLKDKDNWFILDKEAAYTERPEDEKSRKALENQVESLSISDPQKKSDLKTAIIRFYNERSIDTKPNLSDFNLKTENGFVILKSHSWQETKIDINKWELVWFWNWIRFSDLSELLNVADLSNRILETQKWKQPKDMPPFQYKIERKWICFNDANSIRQDIITRNNSWMDARVLSTWRWWATSKIDTLSKYPEDFAKYLSNRRIEDNKVNIDAYPMIKSTKIDFTNSKEANEAEELLKTIKHELRMREKRDSWDAFEISTNVITTKTYIKFFTKWWKTKEFDISNYPTLIRNKDKLLKYINNPSNKMRQSQRPI